ncbi:subtilisin-like protease SBT1.8 [Neltuma alba]|uniref:subtilisin-like protease SBT1.8 n=1 Tax=Neltuma alba TaxID=207710 RepID=UPI0010A590D2|nr:subtilisin-like protease SBT1.8 [Prosopis alba]XP_028796656.1 subtilisin-like protease SBT1.8 [Prosopis alba]
MASVASSSFLFLLLLLGLSSIMAKKTYIVHMKHHDKPSVYPTARDWYSANLQSLSSSSDSDSLLYSYTSAYNGFAASLDASQVDALRRSDSVLGVYEDTVYTLHTTRTPEFLGLETQSGTSQGHNTLALEQASHDVIIGILDTGVWPESKSFDDTGMPEIPSRWRGECESGPDFNQSLCNKKLIGARSFSRGFHMASGGSYMRKEQEAVSPRDRDGHGTHTASTAAGSPVPNASLLGYARGTARGMAPQARVAAYKVCWSTGCFASDILAGMDRAIQDGVDVLSLSLGGGSAPYYRDTIAIGAFAAMERGIFVSCSAGNSGPSKASVANVAPWIMTVGAGTLDRDFPAYVSLGSNKRFNGVSLYSGKGMGDRPVSLVYNRGSNSSTSMCMPGSLDPSVVRGKVVICDRGINARVEKGEVVRDAGGVGMILANTAASGEELVADSHLLPALEVGRKVGDEIREYVRTDPNPTAILSFGGTVLNVTPSPVVAAFSSRGPNLVTPQILKPDVIGPGVNILAGWSEAIGPSGLSQDSRKTNFNIMSGTSMSCPHISGLAGLLKAAHPDWSPSAIKSALMTTAHTRDNTNSPLRDAADGGFSTPMAHGAGHVNPQKAISPGLVYDASASDYIAFLCSLRYSPQQIQLIAKRPNVTCSRKFSDPGQLNYPSFSVVFGSKRAVRYTRTLTNVGEAGSVYDVAATGPSSLVGMTVKPTKLVFKKVGERQRYTVTFVSKKGADSSIRSEFGSIVWSNDKYQVASPVAFAWTELD